MVEFPAHDAFARHVGEAFVLQPPEGERIELELVEATALPRPGPVPDDVGRKTPFSLVFQAHSPLDLPQRTYRLEHGTLGEFDVFLVPIGRSNAGVRLEAIFN